MVTPNSGITSIASLAGRKIGVNGTTSMLQFGMLSLHDTSEVNQGTPVRSMIDTGTAA